MPDELTFDETINNSTREKSKIFIALDPTVTPLVFVTPPACNNIGGWKPTTTVTRTALFTDGDTGSDQVTVRVAGGKQTFQSTAPSGNAVISSFKDKAEGTGAYSGGAKGGRGVMVRYINKDGEEYQGQGVLVYDGEQGDTPEATKMEAFGVEWQRWVRVPATA